MSESRSNKPSGPPPHFLLVEDDVVSAMVVQRAFGKLGIRNPLRIAHDAREALDVLRGTEGAEPLPQPCVILLDLNLPGMNGLSFLAQLRQDEALAHSVVFVVTTSRDEGDRRDALALGAKAYVVKSNLVQNVREITELLDAEDRDDGVVLRP